MSESIRDRVIEQRKVSAAELRANPLNFRTHDKAQRKAFRGMLAEIGFAGSLTAYYSERADGALTLIDGHLRTEEVTADFAPACTILDLNDQEADKLLAAFDRIGYLAGNDKERLSTLLNQIVHGDDDLDAMLSDMARSNGIHIGDVSATREVAGGKDFKVPIETLKAPFIWFGGKRRVAGNVWAALGDVDNYVEPFAGSLAVLLGRPKEHVRKAETVNDADAFIANFWRALEHDPEATAAFCDRPVNEIDSLAIHTYLVNTGRERIAKMESDPDAFDAQTAGWWVWGINLWIGSGWCSGKGPWHLDGEGKLTNAPDSAPTSADGDAGQGVNRQLPHLGAAGQGVNRQLPHLGDAGQGGVYGYFTELAQRLRNVRVCCGDWSRVVTEGALSYGQTVGIFLDPPYLGSVRTSDLYSVDDHTIANEVRQWCIDNGENPRYRIVLAGYWQEHALQMPAGWTHFRYSAGKAYGTHDAVRKTKGNGTNRHNECLWFSPHSLAKAEPAKGAK